MRVSKIFRLVAVFVLKLLRKSEKRELIMKSCKSKSTIHF